MSTTVSSSESLPISDSAPSQSAAPSGIEQFLRRFFQEQNIKWMLVMGAGIVFASSLMLVTKAWPDWTMGWRILTILAYTAAIFVTGQLARTRLSLTATHRVLSCLTLLLLPICFLSLSWLSPGSAVQAGAPLAFLQWIGLLLAAIGLLWVSARKILDHLLRGRQTSFLWSYALLCVMGVVPTITHPWAAMAFVFFSWLVYSVGVVKVNRHTFWLTTQHQLPRIFGFFPIAMLGLQFAVLVSIKAIAVIDWHWIGMVLVLIAATILLTARSVADVYRQKTGNLVRPLPWPIVLPLLIGLLMALSGVALSFAGFHYVGSTTFAVVPTCLIAAALMTLAARDTQHRGFVWLSIVLFTVAYQCSPTLFSQWVESAKVATADAINRPRVPFSLYGLTYLPLIGLLSTVGVIFKRRAQEYAAKPIQQFVTCLSIFLFAIAATDIVSLFFVSTANIVVFVTLAILFSDRRYVLPAIVAVVAGLAAAIPAINDMGYWSVDANWSAVVLTGLAIAMTISTLPDRLIGRIALPKSNDVITRWAAVPHHHWLAVVQLSGVVLATACSIQWVGFTLMRFGGMLESPAIVQFGLLLAALVLAILRNPHYLISALMWGLIGYAMAFYLAFIDMSWIRLASESTWGFLAISAVGYCVFRVAGWIRQERSLSMVRRSLGLDAHTLTLVPRQRPYEFGDWARRVQAFVVPLFDLSFVALSCLVVFVHLPSIVMTHWAWLRGVNGSGFTIGQSESVFAVLWILAAAFVLRSRFAAIVAALGLPLTISFLVIASPIQLPLAWIAALWAVVEVAVSLVFVLTAREDESQPIRTTLVGTGQKWLLVTAVLSGLWFGVASSVAASVGMIGLLAIAMLAQRRSFALSMPTNRSTLTGLAVLAHFQLLQAICVICGCTGFFLEVLWTGTLLRALPALFLATSISCLLLQTGQRRGLLRTYFETAAIRAWESMLLGSLALMMAFLLTMVGTLSTGAIALVSIGFLAVVWMELRMAVEAQTEVRVWTALSTCGLFALFLLQQHVITLGVGLSQFVLLGLSIAFLGIEWFLSKHTGPRYQSWQIVSRPLTLVAQVLPAVVTGLAVLREFGGLERSVTAINSFSLLLAAGVYFQQAVVKRQKAFGLASAVIANVALMFLWRTLDWSAWELYLVPIGMSVLLLVELLKKELPKRTHDPLRYLGALTILVSPMFEILGGSWLRLFILMVFCVLIILLSIGLKIRSLAYVGSAFLVVDLVAMVVRSTMDNPNLLWVGGVLLGGLVIALAAFCENHREQLLSRIRMMSSQLASWE